jgi:hypothetical protein
VSVGGRDDRWMLHEAHGEVMRVSEHEEIVMAYQRKLRSLETGEPEVYESGEEMKSAPRVYTALEAEQIHDAVASRPPLNAPSLPLSPTKEQPQRDPGRDRE